MHSRVSRVYGTTLVTGFVFILNTIGFSAALAAPPTGQTGQSREMNTLNVGSAGSPPGPPPGSPPPYDYDPANSGIQTHLGPLPAYSGGEVPRTATDMEAVVIPISPAQVDQVIAHAERADCTGVCPRISPATKAKLKDYALKGALTIVVLGKLAAEGYIAYQAILQLGPFDELKHDLTNPNATAGLDSSTIDYTTHKTNDALYSTYAQIGATVSAGVADLAALLFASLGKEAPSAVSETVSLVCNGASLICAAWSGFSLLDARPAENVQITNTIRNAVTKVLDAGHVSYAIQTVLGIPGALFILYAAAKSGCQGGYYYTW